METIAAATKGRNYIVATELQANEDAMVVISELSVETTRGR